MVPWLLSGRREIETEGLSLNPILHSFSRVRKWSLGLLWVTAVNKKAKLWFILCISPLGKERYMSENTA
jgi:hypothetical protein